MNKVYNTRGEKEIAGKMKEFLSKVNLYIRKTQLKIIYRYNFI